MTDKKMSFGRAIAIIAALAVFGWLSLAGLLAVMFHFAK